MKVFWSWQSDTDGKTGRHLVKAALLAAIARIKEPADIEEPIERTAREDLHLDQDRQGVSGSPDLARTIFLKIDQSAVFVVDVTLVAETSRPAAGDAPATTKRLINSNVAIEYGYAAHSLGDGAILMVQNTHYGPREELPFDLRHKAGPIQFQLPPTANKRERAAEQQRLTNVLAEALRLCLTNKIAPTIVKFAERVSTTCPAFFWKKGEVLARIGPSHLRASRGEEDDSFEYRFDEPRCFYMRLIPTVALSNELTNVSLIEVAGRRRVRVLTRTHYGGQTFRNEYGAIVCEAHGTSKIPLAVTQLFQNGEIWAVSREFAYRQENNIVIGMPNLEKRLTEGIASFIEVARDDLSIPEPYEFEFGAVGLQNVMLSLPTAGSEFSNQTSGRIYQDELKLRRVMNAATVSSQGALVKEFLRRLYDLAGVSI